MDQMGIKLACENMPKQQERVMPVQEFADTSWERSIVFGENLMNLAGRIGDDPPRQLFMLDPADALKDMAEGPVAQIMKQRRRQTGQLIRLIDRDRSAKLLDHFPRRLHD